MTRVPDGLRALTILVRDVRVGDVLFDRDSGAFAEVVAVRVTPHVVILEMRGALDWRYPLHALVEVAAFGTR
jgi:hypothetical protein